MAKSFVYLEITDPEIVALVDGIRTSMGDRSSGSGVHVTIRGPYSNGVPPAQLLRYDHLLRGAPVVLEGVDTFEMPDRVVVYLKVQHKKLRRIWWKPDYPVEKYGFNPHITLYEGPDLERAARLYEFLRHERMALLTWDYAVTPHVADHKDMFLKPRVPDLLFLGLVNRGVVRADLLARLERSLH